MPNLNANVQVDRPNIAPEVNLNQGGASQAVDVNWSANTPQTANVEFGGGNQSYQIPSGQQGYSQQGNGSYLEQQAARDLGSRAQPQMQSQAQQAQQEQPRQSQKIQTKMTDAIAAGMRTPGQQRRAPEQGQSRVPVVQIPDTDMPVMTSRTPTFNANTREQINDALPDELVLDSWVGAAPVQTTSAQAAPNKSVQNVEARNQQSAAAVREEIAKAEQEGSTQEIVDSDRPDSIFNRSFGYNQKDRKARTRQASLKRPSSVIKAIKNKMADAFRRSGVGYRIYQKMLALPSLDFREIGVGMQEIMAAVDQNADMVNRLLAPFMDEQASVEMWSANEIANFINSHEIYVGTFKPPNNRGQDVQRRRLRVLTTQQRGIYLHPVMAAMYTADFDGDDMEVSLDPKVADLTRDPMDYMVGIDGKQSLNVDFLPVSKIVGNYSNGKNAHDFVREVMFNWVFDVNGKPFFSGFDMKAFDALVDAVIELSDSALKDSDAQAVAWGKVFEKARDVGNSVAVNDTVSGENRNNSLMSRLCRSVYQGMHDIKVYNVLHSIDADIIGMDKLPDPVAYDDSAIYSIVREMVTGQVPNNFQELKVMLSGFIGNVGGKNAPFRFTADVGKMMKMDTRLQVGDGNFVVDPNDVEQMKMFFESTVKYAESQRMAREVKKAGRSQYYTQLMRERVINEVGFPERYATYSQFLTAFCQSYNRNSAIINEANLVFLSTMGISSDSNRGLVSPLNPTAGGVTLGDLAEPMRSIYGNYSVGRMFGRLSTSGRMGERNDDFFAGNPNAVRRAQKHSIEREYDYKGDVRFWVTGKYLNRSLNEFVHENRLIRGETGMEDEFDKNGKKTKVGIRNTTIKSLEGRNDIDVEFEMLLAIADKRTGTASKFNEKVYGKEKKLVDARTRKVIKSVDYKGTTVMMMAELLSELNSLDTDGTVNGRRDQMLWVNDVIDALIASGPDMFMYFGMDNTAGFLQSKWTKKMVEHANNPEVLGGIRTAMIFDYRMERITDLLAKLPNPNENIDQYMDVWNNLEFARDELGASSEVWHGIISEFMAEESEGQESVFQMMRNGLLLQTGPNGRRYAWDIEKDARDFWANPGGHTTLRSVIEDLDLDRRTKWNVIADVVRYWEHDAYLKSYEVGFQLEIGNDSSYSLTSAGSQSALGTHRDFEQAFNRWGKTNQEKLQEEVDNAFKTYGDKRGKLMQTLQRLDSSPWELIQIDDMMYADSILSVKDKVYAQTEKASQHPWTNAIYAALSFQRNGGYMNDITRTDDRLLGLTSVDAVGIDDVVHILTDPEAEMWVYNEYGEIGQITRDILLKNNLGRELGQDVEQDIWEFLKQEPRIASAIRAHNACVMADTDGTGYLGSSLSLSETIARSTDAPSSPVQHVRYLMRDHPVYAGIISMASKAPGNFEGELREITSFRGEYSFLSNFYTTDVTVDGITYSNAEAAFQAQKCENRNDRLRFVGLDGRAAKRLGRQVQLRENWDAIKENEMRRVIEAKFSNPELRNKLLSTGTANLVEGNNWGDTTWGVVNGSGQNLLGRILMDQRGPQVRIGSVTRNERQRVSAIERYLSNQIYQYASSDMSSEGSAQAILRDLGITSESISAAIRSDYDVFLETLDLSTEYDNGEMEDDAITTYNTVAQYMTRYIDEVRQNVQLGMQVAEVEKPSNMGVDVSSVASFWDVVQELGGAKTSVSTGIEGAETYQFGEWASHISARDQYADLEAVFDDVDQSWNGMWTNLRNPDGSPILLEVDENNEITNYRQLMDAKKDQGYDEVITTVPAGYDVRDRSTDSHGNPVPSLFAYMVSKRSNGAEAFNLKAKKAGLDGKDSVTKMQGKYRMVNDQGTMRRTNFFEVQRNLQQLAQQNGENGLMVAKAELALMMMQENAELGYDDLTLANYMCIADLMLIEGEDGVIHLRSLEMLFSAIKYRLGSSVDEMTDEEIINAANQIVNDTSEDGVGIAEMAAAEAFDNIKPRSKSSSVSGIRSNSSVFERNYNLLSAIEEDAATENIRPMSPARAEQLDKKFRKVEGVKNVLENIEVTRNYSIVGYVGGSRFDEINWTVGPSHAIIIGNGDVSDQTVTSICDKAWQLGMTVIVSAKHQQKIPNRYRSDAMPCSVIGDVLIPCFDMRLNGAESTPYNGGRFSTFQAPFSRYVVSVEDSINEYQLGDAEVKPTRKLVDRVKVVENGSTQVRAEDLFPNVFRNPAFKHSLFSVSLASGTEIQNLIANGVKCSIDYGVVEGGRGFDQRKKDVDAAIERYQDRWSEANADGIIMGGMTECAPGDIVAWAEVEIRDQYTGETQYALAPIIPFQLHGATKGIPEKFTVEQVGTVDNDNTLFAVDWSNSTDISNSFAKYFDSSGGANKGMVDFTSAIDADLLLRDGTPVDAYIAKASTDSRKIGTDRRIKTMISLMAMARMHGYNFAKSEGAFPSDREHPENDDIRERLLHKRIPTSEWRGWLSGDRTMLFTVDQRLNAFINYECRKVLANGGNPSDYLANVFTDANDVEHNTHIMWEFEAMFDQGLNYEDSLLRFLHAMDPKLCPNGIDDDTNECYFRLAHDGDGLAQGYDSGVLQMQVPHRLSNGSVSYLWDNVYIGMSFFGEDYSGFSRPNIDGASNFLDAMNTMSYYGAQLDELSARFRVMWASADIGRIPHDGGALGKR